jgi:hypothetical protein
MVKPNKGKVNPAVRTLELDVSRGKRAGSNRSVFPLSRKAALHLQCSEQTNTCIRQLEARPQNIAL